MSPPLEGCGHSVPKPFYCREWVFAKVAHILDNRTPDKIQASNISGVLLTGEPGAGKTALCSELLVRHHQKSSSSALTGRVLASHFINAYQPETQSVSGFIRRIVGEISRSELIQGYAEKLRHPELSEWLVEDNSGRMDREPDEAFQRLVLFPLLEIDTPARNLLLVVDSLDEPTLKAVEGGATSAEQDSDTSQSIAELLANHHHLLPPWLLLFLSLRRSNKPLCRLFTGFKKIALDQVKRGSVVRDVQQYILSRLEKEPALRRHLTRETAPSLNMLHIKSHGCLLYVEAVLDGVSDGSVLLRDIPEIPGTLNGLYLWLCQRLFTRRGWIKVQPLLALLLAARRPSTQEELYRAAQTLDARMTKSEYRKRMQMLRKLLVSVPVDGRDGSSYGWTVFHSSFGEWLSDVKHCTQRFLVKSAEGHARWAVTLAALGESMNKRDVEDLTFHLGRMQPQGKLEAWHLPLWLLWTKAPLPDTTELEVMVTSLGAAVVAAANMELSPDEEELPLNGSQEPELRVKEEIKADPVSPIATEESIRDCESSLKSTADDEEEEDQEVPAPTAASVVERRNSIRLLRPRDYSLNESEDPEQTLFYAAQMGYTSAVSRLCTRYRSSISSAALRHALSIAARQGHAALVSILLEAGADPDVADSEGWTPLRASAWGGHASTVQVLLERGAQVDACDSEGRTALRAAAWAGHEEVVRALLNAGAKVDGEDRQGRTPLIAAAYMGHADIVTALLDAGAKPDHVDGEGRTALSVAVLSVACRISNPAGAGRRHSRGKKYPAGDEQPDKEDSSLAGTLSGTLEGDDYESVETVTILLEYGACVNHQDKEGMTPLLVAAFEGHRMMCELLLEAEADVDQADSGGRTPILAAASMGHSHIVELLLFWGCYVDSIDAEGRTVLSVAAAQGSVEVVRRLLDRGLDEAHRDNTGWTPLHYAAYEGHPVVVDLLMEVGARPDAVDNDGRTAILLAAQEGHSIVVEKLIAAGSDVNQTSLDGKSPLRSAALESHLPVLSALIQAGADVSSKDADGRSTLYLLAIENKVEPAEIILKAGHYDLDKDRDLEGRTPLHIASWQGKSDMVELLLRYGADVNSVDREQRTPLQSSAWQGHEKVVWLLLKAGARCDQPCAQGATPLSIAAQEGHEEVARLLLASGADPNRADGCGRTALKLAMKGGHKKVIQLLENWTSSLDSTSHPATNNSRLLLSMNGNDLHKDYSTASTFETGSGKSSSNLTSSSTPRSSSQRIIELNPVSCSQQQQPLSFTQQLQKHAGRPRGTAGLNLPLSSRILTPLSEPQSPLYSSPPPPTPPGSNNMLIITDPPVWQPLNGHRSSKFSLLRNKDHRSDGGSSNGSCGTPPLPQRTSSVDPDRPPSSPSTSSVQRLLDSLKGEPMVSRPSSVPPAQSSHMQIILGPPSKSRRNGFGQRPVLQQSVSRDSSHQQHNGGGFSGLMAGIRNSALLHGSTKLKNALCNAVGRAPAGVIKKETQL